MSTGTVPSSSGGKRVVWHIDCRIGYLAGADQIEARIRSRSTSSASDTELMNRWVAQHRPGDSLVVHYDPADHQNAVLTTTDMPYAGPRTPNNLTLLLIAATACAVFLTIGRLMRSKAEETVGPASS